MTVFYPLKIASPTQFVEPVSHYLEKVESPEKSHLFREVMQQITLLRNKVTSLVNYDGTIECVNKYINAIEMYVRLARLMAQHLNWNKEFGETVEGLTLTWQDSFNPSLTCTKGEIDFDIFCCYYNLGVLYFQKSYLLAKEDLMSVWEESARSAKIAAYLFNRMRTYYYHAFMNSGFIDTNYSHLDML